jgi:metal-responsive CopG/Arc/MetJ family transcriptional regulator
MRTRQTMTISLPPEMIEQVEQVRKAEHRTRSELVREALRSYIASRFPAVTPSLEDVRALRQARREHVRGQFVNLDDLLHALDTARRPVGRKRA